MAFGFYFKDLKPDHELETYSNAALNRVMDKAPFGATASATVERRDNLYEAHAEIVSKWGPILASVHASDPRTAVNKLIEKIQAKFQARLAG